MTPSAVTGQGEDAGPCLRDRSSPRRVVWETVVILVAAAVAAFLVARLQLELPDPPVLFAPGADAALAAVAVLALGLALFAFRRWGEARRARRRAGRLEREARRARREERRLREAQRVARMGSWEWEVGADELHWSDGLHELYGVDEDAFGGDYEAFLERVHPEDREKVEEAKRRALETAEPYQVQYRVVRDDGAVRVARGYGEVETGPDGEPEVVRGIVRDVTDLHEARAEARELESRYRDLFDMSPVAVAVSTVEGTLLDVNRAFEEAFGYERGEVIGRDVEELDVWADARDRKEVVDRLRAEGSVREFETVLRTRTGERRSVELSVDRVEIGGRPRLSWAGRDVTERKQYRRQLERQALYDSVTGLPNRSLLLDRLDHALDRARRHESTLSLLFVDLDEFKAVNDSYGHAAGDEVLEESARRMEATLRAEDTVARLSGDEFVVLLEEAGEEEACRTGERLRSQLGRPFEVGDGTIALGASVGVAVRRPEGEAGFVRGEDLLQAADSAMYWVKRRGGDDLHLFTPDDIRPGDRLRRRERLRRAIEEDELVVYYQPIVDLRENRITGVEALVRWEHPGEGLVPPGDFVPLAEETGLVRPLDHWVAGTAFADVARWRGDADLALPDDFVVAVNMAPHRYEETDLARRLLDQLEGQGLPPSMLQLEITERLALQETRPFHDLRREGVQLAIDDFGSGYSSLMYLRHLDADALKIDRFFVQELENEDPTSIIVRSVLSIGSHLGLEVIAEGVESAVQRDHLCELGCRLAQGYYFARPMPADEVAELLRPGRELAVG